MNLIKKTFVEAVIELLQKEGYIVLKKEKFESMIHSFVDAMEIAQEKPAIFPKAKQPAHVIIPKTEAEKKFEQKIPEKQQRILNAIKSGEEWYSGIAKKAGISQTSLGVYLAVLVKKGLIKKVGYGKYALPKSTKKEGGDEDMDEEDDEEEEEHEEEKAEEEFEEKFEGQEEE